MSEQYPNTISNGIYTPIVDARFETEWTTSKAPAPANHKVYRSGLTDSVATLNSRTGEKNEVGAFTITSGALKMQYESRITFGASPHKLLMMGVKRFTPLNAPKQKPEHLRVSIPISEYAKLRNDTSLAPRPTSTPEEAEAEAKRLVHARENLFKKIRRDIKALRGQIEYEETLHKKPYKYSNTSFLGAGYIDGSSDEIILEFTLTFAEYLVQNTLSQFSDALFSLPDDKYNTPYLLGLKLQYHFNMDNNQIKGTADRLMVETLLKHLGLPTIEDLKHTKSRDGQRETDRSYEWETRIKEPFERALDALVECNFLAPDGWHYTRSKSEEITDEDMWAGASASYDSWAQLYVQFELFNAPDHAGVIEASKERAAKKAAKKKNDDRNAKRRAQYAERKKKRQASEETGEK